MKKKLKIADLKVESFVTGDQQDTIKGGRTNGRECYFSIVVCVSVDYCPTQGAICETRFC
ncbi:MAG: pinensin family lanthipeptide [Cyclobacteriaceae bacterium]